MDKLVHMDEKVIEALRDVVTPQKPFGPENAGEVRDPDARWRLFNPKNALCKEYTSGPKIIIGRRGSGKSSMLLNTDFIESHDFVVRVKTQDALSRVNELAELGTEPEKVYVETISELWRTCFNTLVMAEVVASAPTSDLLRVRKFLSAANVSKSNGFSGIIASFEKNAEAENVKFGTAGVVLRSFLDFVSNIEVSIEDALGELDSYLRKKSAECLIVIDSIEDYALGFDDNKRVMRGVMKCVGEYGNKRRQISLCILREYYFDVRK